MTRMMWAVCSTGRAAAFNGALASSGRGACCPRLYREGLEWHRTWRWRVDFGPNFYALKGRQLRPSNPVHFGVARVAAFP
jgi:hypothetical protein